MVGANPRVPVSRFAMGMLMNVAAAMDLPAVDERWTKWCSK